MTAVIKAEAMTVVEPRQVEHIKTSLPPLRGQYPTSRDEAEATKNAIRELDTPADPRWLAQRVVTLLTHYFITDAHPAALESIAMDWTHELGGYPDWAIEAACKWWLSRHNPKRRYKPMPGDISERAQVEAAIINTGRKQVEFYERYGENPPAFLA